MSDDLATLETQRSKLLEEFLRLGDLRPGSITAVTRRCGKPSCHCAKPNDPTIPPRCARRSKKSPSFTVCRGLARTWSPSTTRSVDSARLRSIGVAGASRKKTAAAIHQEVAREVNQLLGHVFAQRRKDGRTDLEAVDSALRTALPRSRIDLPLLGP
jgi:hypothetical protein